MCLNTIKQHLHQWSGGRIHCCHGWFDSWLMHIGMVFQFLVVGFCGKDHHKAGPLSAHFLACQYSPSNPQPSIPCQLLAISKMHQSSSSFNSGDSAVGSA